MRMSAARQADSESQENASFNEPVEPDLSQLTPRTKEKAEKLTKNMNGVRDIVKLLRALEEEIAVCESNLKEGLFLTNSARLTPASFFQNWKSAKSTVLTTRDGRTTTTSSSLLSC